MSRRSDPVEQIALPLETPAEAADRWLHAVNDAVQSPARTAEALAMAEDAVRACPGDGPLLLLAATAALLNGKPDRAQVFLRLLRLSGRFNRATLSRIVEPFEVEG